MANGNGSKYKVVICKKNELDRFIELSDYDVAVQLVTNAVVNDGAWMAAVRIDNDEEDGPPMKVLFSIKEDANM